MKNLSVVDGEAIRNNLLNNSPSKLGYTFCRTDRFRLPLPNCPTAFYQNNSKLAKRATSFGYGTRSDFTKTLTCSPPVTKYNPEAPFNSLKPEFGKTFGICRDMSPENGILVKGIQRNPGVGQYDSKGETASNICYSMRSRTLDVIHLHNSSKETPGPAAYNHKDEFPANRFSADKYENPKLGKIGKDARFVTPKESPGPQSYVAPDNLSTGGKYVISNHCGNGIRRFSQTARSSNGFTETIAKNKSKNPGPGAYERHSEFGVYGDSKYYKTLGSFGKFGDNNSKANETH